MNEDIVKKAKIRAIHLLEYMDRTEKELKEKLQKNQFPPEVIEETIEYLKFYGYVDDKRYACQYLNSRLEKKGRHRLFFELQQKGVSEDLIQEAWDELCLDMDVDEKSHIDRLVEKKIGSQTLFSRKEYERLIRFLARRGFSWDDISAVLEDRGISMAADTEETDE